MRQFFALLKNLAARPKLWVLMVFSWAAGGLGFAQLPTTFYNNGNYSYPPQSPNFVATNFYNDYGGIFSMNTASADTSWSVNLYNGWQSTLNFTNFGEMDSDFGFFFDQKNGSSSAAANFLNQGTINCGTGNNAVLSILGAGGLGVVNFGYGGFFIYATNVVNNGSLNVGLDGLGRVWGQNVDLTRGTFSMAGGGSISGVGEAFVNTNNWEPDVDLGQNFAISSPIKLLFGGDLFLFPSVPYFSIVSDSTGTNITVRMVFIQDNSGPNVTNNIYFGGALFGSGFTTVGWAGTYIDNATGDVFTNYVYLNDDYVDGASTNVLNKGNVIPGNFALQESTTPLNLGAPATTSFPLTFPAGQIVTTNIYSYADVSLAGSTVPLSSTFNGAVTNIVGRIEVAATNELNLSLTEMSGMNYVLLRSTNNFDYDGQSFIEAPYADLYLGRTNNSMAITNLIQPQIPAWSGSIQAWNTRWFYTDTNAGINYDFRVLLVQSDLQPAATPVQQDVMLYSTNNVIISDVLNITRNFYVNCTNLVTTTNEIASGAASPDGELNLLNATNLTWQSCTPFLRNLTNAGAIRTVSGAVFGTPAVPYFALYNSGVISNGAGCSINAGDFENYGAISAGTGTFAVETINSTMTNSSVTAGGSFTNVSSTLIVSNVSLLAGKGMTFIVTNLLTDEDCTNNFWSLGRGNYGAGIASGLTMPGKKPTYGDLLLTTITNIATTNTLVNLTWAGNDLGISNLGYSNNVAIGQMIFDAQASAPRTGYAFNAAGSSNAMYIDQIILLDAATNLDSHGNVSAFSTFNNLNIYYGDVIINGVSVAEKLNHKNSNHLHWVATYAGIFSGTNIVFPPGVTNRINFALANSPDLDSNGNGTPNVSDPDPVFVPAQIDFTQTLTNLPPRSIRIQWNSIPASTNYLLYTTNLTGGNWLVLTNFISPATVPPVAGWPLTNTVYDVISTNHQKFYQVHVDPNTTDLYGP